MVNLRSGLFQAILFLSGFCNIGVNMSNREVAFKRVF